MNDLNGEWGMVNGECLEAERLSVIPHSPFPTPHSKRSAFTLLELLLTLAIAAILIATMTAAINIQLHTVDAARGEVEQAQLARALLRRIADDLRASIPYPEEDSISATAVEANDATNLANAAMASMGSTATAGAAGASSGGGSAKGGSSSGGSQAGVGSGTKLTTLSTLSKQSAQSPQSAGGSSGASGAAGATTSTNGSDATAEETPLPAGFLGNQYDLQIEIARLPNPHQSAVPQAVGVTQALSSLNPTSDVRTVSYYVSNIAGASNVGLSPTDSLAQQSAGGLIRGEIDRAASHYAGTTGGATTGPQSQRVLAPEVTAIMFRYYDGTMWQTSWDSSVSTALPKAVEVTISVRSTDVPASGWQLQSHTNMPTEQMYSLVVHIPAASHVPVSETETETEDTSSSSSSSSSSTGAGT